MTQEEIKVAMERAKVYPAGTPTTCWFWDQESEDDDGNLLWAFQRIANVDRLGRG